MNTGDKLINIFDDIPNPIIIVNSNLKFIFRNRYYNDFVNIYDINELELFTYITENQQHIVSTKNHHTFFNIKDNWNLDKKIKVNFKSFNDNPISDELYFVCSIELFSTSSKYFFEKQNISFSVVADNSPFVVYVCNNDKNWTMLYLNNKIKDLSGRPKDDFIENKYISYADIIYPDDRKYVSDEIHKALEKKTSFRLLYRIINSSGEIKHVEENGAGIYQNGKLLYLEGYIQDISDRVELENLNKQNLKSYEYIFNNSYTMMMIVDINSLSILDVNDILAEYYGYSKKELLGQNLSFIHTLSESEIKTEINKLFSNNNRITRKTQHRKSNGVIIDVEIFSSVIALNGKDIIFSIISDITEKVASMNALIEESKRLNAILEATNDAVWIWDFKNDVRFANDKFYEMLDYGKDTELFNPEFRVKLIHPEDKDKYVAFTDAISKNLEFGELEYRVQHRLGHYIWVYSRGFVYKDENGKPSIVAGSMHDISRYKNEEIKAKNHAILFSQKNHELRKLNRELINAKNRAEESDRMKTSFLALLSHELRTPLNAINGFSNLILEETEIDEIHKYAIIVNNSGEKLLEIINDLLDISNIEFGKVTLIYENIAIVDIFNSIDRIISDLKNQYLPHSSDIEIIYESECSTQHKTLKIDTSKLIKSLKNILDNAFKFTSKGEIRYGCKIKANKFCFYVKDTGIGIEEEKLEEIFSAFRQNENYSNRMYGGLGIGLNIAKNYVRMLGGSIDIYSTPNEGTLVEVLFNMSIMH